MKMMVSTIMMRKRRNMGKGGACGYGLIVIGEEADETRPEEISTAKCAKGAKVGALAP
jgi:hypothetical protein